MRVLSRRLPAFAAAALAAACAACGSSQATSSTASAAASGPGSFPTTVTAANGRVHIGSRPTAIISLSPTSTEMLYAIGAGGQVRAVDSDSDYPPQAPRTKLSGFQPNVEAIVGYKPDLVVVDANTGGLIKSLAAFKIPVLELPAAATLSDVYAQFDELGRATGHLTRPSRRTPSCAASSRGSPRRRRITRRRSPTTTSLTRPTTRSPRPRSSGSCCT